MFCKKCACGSTNKHNGEECNHPTCKIDDKGFTPMANCSTCKHSERHEDTCSDVGHCRDFEGWEYYDPYFEKSCDNCRFNDNENNCKDNREFILGNVSEYCTNNSLWKPKSFKYKNSNRCENCRYSSDNNGTTDVLFCPDYKKEQGIIDVDGHDCFFPVKKETYDSFVFPIPDKKRGTHVTKLPEPQKCSTCRFSSDNNGGNKCGDYRKDIGEYYKRCAGYSQWEAIIETSDFFDVKKILARMSTISPRILGVQPMKAPLDDETYIFKIHHQYGVKNMNITKIKSAGKTALQIKTGEQADKTLKKLIQKAFPHVEMDSPFITAGLALIVSILVDNTKFKDSEQAQFIIQGMFDNAAIKGVEATGIIEKLESFVDKIL